MPSVIVGISGGVDSSISLHLLKSMGYDVEAVIFKQVNVSCADDDSTCCSASAIDEAKAVCRALGVVLHIIDLRDIFKTKVILPAIQALTKGDTPSPCTDCNGLVRSVKLDYIRLVRGLDFFATGHYFQVANGQVYRGLDSKKDQSYMVALVKKDYFSRWLTPVGNLQKPAVRAIAAELNLPTAHNPDSQDLCFKHLLPSISRSIVYNGSTIGTHVGRPTIGQKKGFSGLRILNVDESTITLTADSVQTNKAFIKNVNLLVDNLPDELNIQLRYRGIPVKGRVRENTIELDSPAILTPGQVAAFYEDDQLLGGAVISR